MSPDAAPEVTSEPVPAGRRRRARKLRRERGVALVLVLGALTILAVMLTDFQDETSAELGSALSTRDSIKAEYAARSALQLSRLLIAASLAAPASALAQPLEGNPLIGRQTAMALCALPPDR